MSRFLFLTMIGVFLSVLPVAAADPEAVLFSDDTPLFTGADTPLINGAFLGIRARQALRKPTKHHLVIAGDEVETGPQEVSINSLTIKPGAELPSSVREITIVGGKTANVTVTGRTPRK
jgi:hypothetical protein